MLSWVRKFYICFVVACLVLSAQEPQLPRRLNLVIVEGEGAINNIKLRTARETIVQVEDENHRPIAGAVVVFLLPTVGPGGTFVTGSKSATIVTDNAGRAVMPRMQLNSAGGRYEIKVHASNQGLEADATIAQSIIATAGGISTGAVVGILAAVGAAGAVAAVVATRGKGGSTPTPATPTPPSGTIGIGSGVTIGPPR